MEPLISVIIPVYKVEKYLRRCVDSLFAQTYGNIGVILVDDGSPDGCPAICDAYAEADSRVRVIHKRNGGLSSARNAGLDIAAGEYIFFVDSDDSVRPEALRTLYDRITADGSDIAIAGYLCVTDDGKVLDEHHVLSDGVITADEMKRLEGHGPYVSACGKLYKRRIFDGLRYREGILCEDYDLLPRLTARCEKISCVDKALFNYTIHEGSIMTGEMANADRALDLADMQAEHMEKYLGEKLGGMRPMFIHHAGELAQCGLRFNLNAEQTSRYKAMKERFYAVYREIKPEFSRGERLKYALYFHAEPAWRFLRKFKPKQ